ncbi:MAG: hypothetical protein IPP37_10500 [Saprospiraceae bacterium]|nr:hypothetical protein [Saprospiraceae bacterium]
MRNSNSNAIHPAGTAITVTDGQLINYTITVTDGAGNTATCTVAVTYEDDDAPTFTCPGAQTAFTNGNVNCEANVPNLAALVADEADNCGTAIVTQSHSWQPTSSHRWSNN